MSESTELNGASLKHAVAALLSKKFGDWHHFNKKNPLNELLFIICSIQTDERKYRAAYNALRSKYRTFSALQEARRSDIARLLGPAGLSRQKANVIRLLLANIKDQLGAVSLSRLRRMSDSACEEFLISLPGVGTKTARCVMLYSLGRQVFPVDTHCWRIARRLGWVRATRPDRSCSPNDMDRLQASIPKDLRYSLHVNMISLGRQFCLPTKPHCAHCPIASICRRVGVPLD
jgi:endonuclease III